MRVWDVNVMEDDEIRLSYGKCQFEGADLETTLSGQLNCTLDELLPEEEE